MLAGRGAAEGELWGDHQNAYFGEHGLDIIVDPVAAVPGEHLGPVRFRHPDSEKVKAAEVRRQINAQPGERARNAAKSAARI
jgi:hypothetical protein